MLWGRLLECSALANLHKGPHRLQRSSHSYCTMVCSLFASFPSSTDTARKRKGFIFCQFSRFALMEFNSAMLSSEVADQKQIRNNESFFAMEEKGTIFPCSDLSLATCSESWLNAFSEINIRQKINTFSFLFFF